MQSAYCPHPYKEIVILYIRNLFVEFCYYSYKNTYCGKSGSLFSGFVPMRKSYILILNLISYLKCTQSLLCTVHSQSRMN